MHFPIVSSLVILLLYQATLGFALTNFFAPVIPYTADAGINELPSESPLDEDSDSDTLQNNNYGSSFKNITEGSRLEDNMEPTISEISSSIADNNNQSHIIGNFSNESKPDNSISISSTQKTDGNFTKEFSSTSSQVQSSSESSTTASEKNDTKSTSSVTTSSSKSNQSSPQPEDEEPERVVLNKPLNASSTVLMTSQPKTLYQRALELVNDTYTLSIVLPIAAGVVFASTIIVTIAACRCMKRQCRRRRLRKKSLPDSVKNLRPSDRARLLAESSDDEF